MDSKALPSSFSCNEAHSLVQCFQKGQSTSQLHNNTNNTCNLCREKRHWTNECLNKDIFATKPCSNTAKSNRCSLGPSRHPGCGNSHRSCGHHQEEQGEQQATKQSWKSIPLTGMQSPKLVNGCTFHWCSKCMLPQLSTTHSMVMHTDYSTTTK